MQQITVAELEVKDWQFERAKFQQKLAGARNARKVADARFARALVALQTQDAQRFNMDTEVRLDRLAAELDALEDAWRYTMYRTDWTEARARRRIKAINKLMHRKRLEQWELDPSLKPVALEDGSFSLVRDRGDGTFDCN